MAKLSRKKKALVEPQPQNLDRFAGSSGSEPDDDEDEESDVEIPMAALAADATSSEKKNAAANNELVPKKHGPDSSDSAAHENNKNTAATSAAAAAADNSDSDSEDEEHRAQGGMANAMARILGATTVAQNQSVVLSKTKTPLQKQALQARQAEQELKEKRRVNLDKNLAALHRPLSVATSHALQGSSALVQELEQERAHRRVATRGVVALFNAIAQHQRGEQKDDGTKKHSRTSSSKSGEPAQRLTKHGFLEMIKSKATASKSTTGDDDKVATKPAVWNALKDDFMMGDAKSKWRDEDDLSGEEPDEDEDKSDKSAKKRRKFRS
jgi:hypothetical protein